MIEIILGITVIQIIFIILIYAKFSSNDDSKEINNIFNLQQKSEKIIRDDLKYLQTEFNVQFKDIRKELSSNMNQLGESLLKRIHESSIMQKNQLDIFSKQLSELNQQTELKLEQIRSTVEQRITELQKDNNQKLEKMRETVDEKLQSTLEKRLSESFKTVSERLEQVHKGLGEMQNLALGVGDLKKVLINVKTRGTWGEIQLANLLEQFLTKDQFEVNVITKKETNNRVEFAIKLPGRDLEIEHILLPIDSKFPIEDYQRLLEAEDLMDKTLIDLSKKALEKRFKEQAKTISELYLNTPYTTDFAIMFLPVECLYAEALRIPGLVELIQQQYRIIITGPNTVSAILMSLQMGFRTLAIEKKSSNIWKILAEVKNEFGKFGDILEKTQKKLQEASNQIDQGATRARSIERKLKNVSTDNLVESQSEIKFLE